MHRFSGKHVVVTGAASGIGRATALLFAEEGAARVYAVDLAADGLEKVAGELAERGAVAHTIVADLTDSSQARRAVAEAAADAGRLDVVVSNAGWALQAPFVEIDEGLWDQTIAINLTAGFHVGQAAARAMIEQGGGGVILFTASGSGYGAMENLAAYCAAKAGIMVLAKTMAVELASHGIRVNSVSPGPTDTPGAMSQVGEEVFEQFRQFFPVPLQRLAQPEEIARAFLYLASDDASYVTAIDLPCDGGITQFATSYAKIPDSA